MQTKKGKRKLLPNENLDTESNITYADDSDDLLDVEESNDCQACGGDENQDVPDAWIGCSQCPAWFHKYCLNDDFENMTRKEIGKLNFLCNLCSQKKQRKQKENAATN